MQADLSHAEAKAAFLALAREIGPKCDIHPGINSFSASDTALFTAVYPRGITGGESFHAKSESYREALDKIRAMWAERSDTHAAHTIREMALAIISITADQGECTDAALRAKFDAADVAHYVAHYGERACEQATEMAGLGPFSIVKLSGANDVGEAA